MRITLCREHDPEVAYYTTMANLCGYVPFKDVINKEIWVCINVLAYEMVWRAADAVFRRMESGTYHFTAEGGLIQIV